MANLNFTQFHNFHKIAHNIRITTRMHSFWINSIKISIWPPKITEFYRVIAKKFSYNFHEELKARLFLYYFIQPHEASGSITASSSVHISEILRFHLPFLFRFLWNLDMLYIKVCSTSFMERYRSNNQSIVIIYVHEVSGISEFITRIIIFKI